MCSSINWALQWDRRVKRPPYHPHWQQTPAEQRTGLERKKKKGKTGRKKRKKCFPRCDRWPHCECYSFIGCCCRLQIAMRLLFHSAVSVISKSFGLENKHTEIEVWRSDKVYFVLFWWSCLLLFVLCFPSCSCFLVFIASWFSPVSSCQSCPWLFSPRVPPASFALPLDFVCNLVERPTPVEFGVNTVIVFV